MSEEAANLRHKVFLHVDMDAFFASVEQRDHPEYRGKPVVVGSPPDQRGVVCAASYEARQYGIHSAMPSREAGRRCPHAVFLPVNGRRYRDVSRQVFAIFERFTPLVEPLSVDEAFLDVTGSQHLFGTGPEIGEKIRSAIKQELGLTASVGVAPNKFLAKLASDMDKPDGLTVVPVARDEIVAFLAPLPVRRIWGVGQVTQKALASANIHTVGQLQHIPLARLASVVGKHSATHLHRLAWGEDAREVEIEHEEKSISREHTFRIDCTNQAQIESCLGDLVEDVGRRLRAAEKFATVVKIKLRWKNFRTITRQHALPHPMRDDFALRKAAFEILNAIRLESAVRLVGFGVSGLTEQKGTQQLDFFDHTPATAEHKEKLSDAVDAIRKQFGTASIRRGDAATNAQDAEGPL